MSLEGNLMAPSSPYHPFFSFDISIDSSSNSFARFKNLNLIIRIKHEDHW